MTTTQRERRPHKEAAPRSTAADTTDRTPHYFAAAYRTALEVAGIDRVPLGVRDEGPLNWTPTDRIEQREPPVAIAQRRILARRRIDELETARRRWRMADRYWTGAA